MNQLLDPRNDFLFKRIFGSEENRDVLLTFLNKTFIEADRPPLNEITFLNPYTEKRTLFYWSKLYSGQLQEGKSYKVLQNCVTINILNYSFLPNNQYHNVFHLREDRSGISLIDDMELHFLELPKLSDHAAPVESGGLVNWLLFLKGVDKSNWEVLTMNEPVLKKAMDTLEFLSQDAEARRLYENRQKYLHDEASMIEGALAEGEARGEKKKAIHMALALLKLGVATDIIAKASGLSETEIIALKEQD